MYTDAVQSAASDHPHLPSDTAPRGSHSRPQVVLAGSMSVRHVMAQLAEQLRASGVDPVVPEPDDDASLFTAEAIEARKRSVSKAHMNCIRDTKTKALLVANLDRHGADDYIGPNSFAEIAVAFADDRKVYLLQGMPAMYRDELSAWGVECLHGDVDKLVKAVSEEDRPIRLAR